MWYYFCVRLFLELTSHGGIIMTKEAQWGEENGKEKHE